MRPRIHFSPTGVSPALILGLAALAGPLLAQTPIPANDYYQQVADERGLGAVVGYGLGLGDHRLAQWCDKSVDR